MQHRRLEAASSTSGHSVILNSAMSPHSTLLEMKLPSIQSKSIYYRITQVKDSVERHAWVER